MIDEKRTAPRKPLRSRVLFRVDGKIHVCYALDISSGGLSVICDSNIPSRKIGEVYFYIPSEFPNGEPFRADAMTANCSYSNSDGGFRLGLIFQKVSQQALFSLTQFLDKR